jgi:hypothetical protein
MMPYTVDKPSPVPRPVGFVVKNGSNARGRGGLVDTRFCFVARGVRGFDRERAAGRVLHRVARVEREVHDDLTQLTRVCIDGPEILLEARDDLDALTDRGTHHLQHILHDRVDVEQRRREQLFAAEREQLPSERGRPVRRAGDSGQVLDRDRGALPVAHGLCAPVDLEHVHMPTDHGEQVVEVVCDAARQLADRLHLLRLA